MVYRLARHRTRKATFGRRTELNTSALYDGGEYQNFGYEKTRQQVIKYAQGFALEPGYSVVLRPGRNAERARLMASSPIDSIIRQQEVYAIRHLALLNAHSSLARIT